MEKTYQDLFGEPMTMLFKEHDISKYKALLHMTLKKSRKSIEEKGLLRFQPQYKSLVQTDLIFLSYPINGNTGDLFRFNEEFHCIIVFDAVKLCEAGYVFYDDEFGMKDASSLRNHLVCEKDIPAEFIAKIIEF